MSFQTTSPMEIEEGEITNIAFFPNVALSACRAAMRIDSTVTTDRLKHALIEATTKTNANLSKWVAQQKEQGIQALSELVGLMVEEGINQHEYYYLHAVYCYTKAKLTEQYRDIDSTAEGHERADEIGTNIDDLWRNYQWALCDLQGISRSHVELI